MAGPKKVKAASAQPARVVRHRVLYMNGQPVMSREEGDPNANDDFASLRLEKITEARNSGAARPVFEETLEHNGEVVAGE